MYKALTSKPTIEEISFTRKSIKLPMSVQIGLSWCILAVVSIYFVLSCVCNELGHVIFLFIKFTYKRLKKNIYLKGRLRSRFLTTNFLLR